MSKVNFSALNGTAIIHKLARFVSAIRARSAATQFGGVGRKMATVPAVVLILISLGTSTLGFAQEVAQPNGDMSSAARANFDGSPNLPDGIAFVHTMRFINDLSESSSLATSFIQSRMGLKGDDATAFVELQLVALEEYESDLITSMLSVACENGVARATGYSGFELLNAVDDAGDALAEQHLSEFRKTLDTDTEERFQQMLDMRKLKISHTTFDYRKMPELMGKDNVDQELASLCSSGYSLMSEGGAE